MGNNKKTIQHPYPDVYCSEALEVLETKTEWLLRYGFLIMLLIVFGLLAGCYLIVYPDTETFPVVITSDRNTLIIKIPSEKSNIVQIGQEVLISTNDYDSSQETMLKGRIIKISNNYETTPIGFYYPIELELLSNDNQKEITKPIQNMNAQATIISEKRLINHILNSTSIR